MAVLSRAGERFSLSTISRSKRAPGTDQTGGAWTPIPATNNGSENAIRGYKPAAKISGRWRTLATLQRHCRIRSYLATACSHGHHPLTAIRDALTGSPWMPPRPA